ncbi:MULTISPECIES: hypothetical protein [Achromobacter]|jgi:uncharacterized lipoprotein|uniref:hypothetical protein n=1 Tax=Achromobacter TaxID=222 RepID=UPI001CB9AD77|nr:MULTISPECIES: hypothetical protein [Achromobacter]WLW60169.1 hypothetical protein RA224_23495 [Achromobacter aegrifaciens]
MLLPSLFSARVIGRSAILASIALLAGCGNVPNTLPVQYSPSSVISAEGAVEVGDFTYEPNKKEAAEQPKPQRYANAGLSTSQQASSPNSTGSYRAPQIAPNQIRNTAIGSILLEKDVKDFVRDATFAELRFIGVKVNGNQQRRLLTAEVEEFLADDLGYSVDWTLRIAYVVTDKATQKPVYTQTKETKRRTNKFANFFTSLNDSIRLSTEALAKDPDFLSAIQE